MNERAASEPIGRPASRSSALLQLAKLFRGAAELLEVEAAADPGPARLLKYSDVAARLSCDRNTVARLAQRGALRLVMVGAGSPRVVAESVDELIAKGGIRAGRPRRGASLLRELQGGK